MAKWKSDITAFPVPGCSEKDVHKKRAKSYARKTGSRTPNVPSPAKKSGSDAHMNASQKQRPDQ